MNQSYMHVNSPYAMLTRARNVFGVQLYKNNARALLSHILSIVNSDWLQHACSVCGMYEKMLILYYEKNTKYKCILQVMLIHQI